MTRIVIIGGGAAGINTAQGLAKNLTEADDTEVVVLEKNSFFYHVVGAPRAYVDADYSNKMFIPYDNAIPKHAKKFVRIVRGVATRISVDPNEVSYHSIAVVTTNAGWFGQVILVPLVVPGSHVSGYLRSWLISAKRPNWSMTGKTLESGSRSRVSAVSETYRSRLKLMIRVSVGLLLSRRRRARWACWTGSPLV
ncbi:hypothetical protein DVH05_028295 [Phytophthora capsici]|nr:hypothetical protein DVH05_028295 [Phytophthora capsici]